MIIIFYYQGHLASVLSEEENTFIVNSVLPRWYYSRAVSRFWIGGKVKRIPIDNSNTKVQKKILIFQKKNPKSVN